MSEAKGAVGRDTVIDALMWLEYAAEGDESCKRATGLDVNGAVWVAHGLLSGRGGWAQEQHARHMADVAIEDARLVSREGDA